MKNSKPLFPTGGGSIIYNYSGGSSSGGGVGPTGPTGPITNVTSLTGPT